MLQEEVHGPLLNGPAGEQCRGRALFIGPEGRHEKTGGLSHPGEDGDVPLGPADPGGEDLLPGDAGLDAPRERSRLCPASHRRTRSSSTVFCSMASRRLWSVKEEGGRRPSGGYSLFSGIL